MDFLNGKIKTLYFKYLAAAFGSALVTSIYSVYYGKNVPLFRRNGYRKPGAMIP